MTPPIRSVVRWSMPALLLFAASCQDAPGPTTVPEAAEAAAATVTPQQMRGQAQDVVSEILALPQTVFGTFDESEDRFVFGVEHMGVARGIRTAMAARGIPTSAYQVRVTPPIRFMSSLRDRHRPTQGGLQIHFSNYLCTLGFSVDHAGGRSFITNSHCTDQQGSIDGTVYYQPASNVDSNPIGTEVDDPSYSKGGGCSRGKVCRRSDAARVLYASGVASNGEIARTTGVNTGSLTTNGQFDITGQDGTTTQWPAGTPFHKVGRTTGWTSGTVPANGSCVDVNVFGSNIQLRCQTFVQNNSASIVGSGDSGSPVFQPSGGNATLVGILWGGSGDNLFVFSPLKNIQQELGSVDATTDGVGSGDTGENPDGGTDEPNCPPNSNSPKCRG